MSAERRRLTVALLFSLLIHTLLLSMTFGVQGFGLPGFGFPWQERRVEAPDLHVVLLPAQERAAKPAANPVKAPLPQASIEQAVAGGSALGPSASSSPPLGRTAEVIVRKAKPEPKVATAAVPDQAPLRTERTGAAASTSIPEPEVIAMERPDEATWTVPPASSAPTSVIAVAPVALSPEAVMPAPPDAGEVTQKQAEPVVRERDVEVGKFVPPEPEAQRQADQLEAARVEAERQEAARIEAARLEAERREAARLAAAQMEAQRQEVARQEAARVEAAQLEAIRREAARLAAAKMEAQRQEIARQLAVRVEAARLEAIRLEAARLAAEKLEAQRQEAARVEAARLEAERREAARLAAAQTEAARVEAERQEAARVEAERQEAARQAAVQQEAARALAEQQEEEAKREARLRVIGRQLNEEAARRKAAETAARPPAMLPYSLSTARRARLWGRTDANVELVRYTEAWARKIQFNTPVDTVREVAKRPHTDPMVTVAIRSDGSVESVTFVLSSGVAEVDEAIRRIVQSHVPYQAFPPGLAREFDVVEVRRTWHFDTAIRLD